METRKWFILRDIRWKCDGVLWKYRGNIVEQGADHSDWSGVETYISGCFLLVSVVRFSRYMLFLQVQTWYFFSKRFEAIVFIYMVDESV
jgi:hypothetical protein